MVAAAALANLGQFPFMPWHTIDGIALVSVGFVLLMGVVESSAESRPWRENTGMVMLGFAFITKQSFMPALFVGVGLILYGRWKQQRSLRTGVRPIALGAAVPLAYGFAISLFGGLGEMTRQLTSGDSVAGEWIVSAFADRDDARRWLVSMAVAIVALLLVRSTRRGDGPDAAGWTGAALMTCLVGWWVLDAMTGWGSIGPMILWWLAVATVSTRLEDEIDVWGLVVATVAWMASLSWGYPTPALLSGSLALFVVHRCWRNTPVPSLSLRTPLIIGSAVVLATAVTSVATRRAEPYRDLPAAELSRRPPSVPLALRGVKTNDTTWRYLEQVSDCLAKYPASNVAVLPDSPALDAIYDLKNPFPLVWPYSHEIQNGDIDRMTDAAAELTQKGDYLVLFQTVRADQLAWVTIPDEVPPEAAPFMYEGWAPHIRSHLGGEEVACGSFVGNYHPAG